MEEFINEFGKENFYIMIAIVVVIFLALFLIIIFEKRNARKIMREQIDNIKKNKNLNKERVIVHDEDYQKTESDDSVEFLEDPSQKEVYDNNVNEEVYYVENEDTKEEAKEKLEEVTKRLIDEQEDSSLIDHTHFEEEQEEKSIISYDELIKASYDIDEKNDKLLADEGEAAITIEELYKKHQEEQDIINNIDAINEKEKVSNPVFEEEKKFKNSDVISPVFGVYSGKEKPQNDVLKEINKNIEQADLEDEIQRTEDFLRELKRLKNKLD